MRKVRRCAYAKSATGAQRGAHYPIDCPLAWIEELDEAVPPETFLRLPFPWPAAFLAGKCFLAYRRAGGKHRSPLPDFYIGAHAAIEAMPLLTRDATPYRTYLPRLELIAPDTA